MEIVPRSLPQLSKQLRDQNKREKQEKPLTSQKSPELLRFFFIFEFKFFVFLVVILAPGPFKTVCETGRNNFHQISSKSELLGPSYDKT